MVEKEVDQVGKILVSHGAFYDDACSVARKMLEDNGWEIIMPHTAEERADIYARRLPELDAVLASGEPWDRETMQRCTKLKMISRFGVGYDNVDLKAAKDLGIAVTNARVQAMSDAVAELALGLIISTLRNIHGLGSALKCGEWSCFFGSHLSGKTVGLLGFGGIARTLARMLKGFDVRLLAYDIIPDQLAATGLGVTLADFKTVLRESDIISLHIPSNLETFHMINEDVFNIMKPTAVFINTSRGSLVDESAMYEALSIKRIAFAATDVFEKEPTPRDNPLLSLDNFLGVPHIGGNTYEASRDMSICAVQNILDIFAGKRSKYLLNP